MKKQLIQKRSHMAVLSSLALMSATYAANSFAACTGSIASPVSTNITVECAGTGTTGNVTNSNATTYVDTSTVTTLTAPATNFSSTLLQLDGQGRVLTNSGSISNNRIINASGTAARNRVAVLMGAATINAGTGTTYINANAANAPTAGATSVKLNAAPAVGVNLVGQTIVLGRYIASEGDFTNGEQRLITAFDSATNTVTFADALTANFAGAGNDPVGYKVISNFGGGDNIIKNSGTISSQITAAEINANKSGTSPTITSAAYTSQSKAISGSVEGNYIINNTATGIIRATHDGIGATYAIEEGGAVTEMTINNAGLIEAVRNAALTLVDNTATGNPTATSTNFAGFTKQTIALVNAINTQEEADVLTLNNASTGIVRATGDYAGAIYMRAAEKNIVNSGLIENVGTKGFAIGAVSDGGEIRELFLTNNESGTINGDILVTNGNALRYYLLSTAGGAAGLNNRLLINNQVGQSDSEITNAGEINGNLYFANGTHTLENSESGEINGNIDVDQRNTTYSTTATDSVATGTVVALDGLNTKTKTATGYNFNIVGTKTFSFENEGKFFGNINIRTASGSQIELKPTITGAGLPTEAAAVAAPQTNIAGMGGTLKISDGTVSTIDSTTTLTPKVASNVSVKQGDWYKVADTLFGTALPEVEDSLLIDWEASNAGGALLIGANLVNANTVTGLNADDASIINNLVSSGDALAGDLLNTTDVATLKNASEQLSPEINNAAMVSALKANRQFLGLIGQQIGGYQNFNPQSIPSGISTGELGRAPSFWVQGYGFTGEQTRRNAKYDTDAYGFAAGVDTLVGDSDSLRVGAAVGYGQTNVDNRNGSKNKLDIDSYQAALYAGWQQPSYYVNGVLSVAMHDYDSKRTVLNNSVNGSHDGWQYTGHVDAGWPFKLGRGTLVPVASLTYSYLDQDGYTEKGAGALKVSNENTDSFRSGLGLRAYLPLTDSSLKTTLEVRGIWLHEFSDTEQNTTARFAAGGGSFTAQGVNLKRDSANIGATLQFSGGSEIKQNLLISYDAEIGDQFTNHTGKITARFDF